MKSTSLSLRFVSIAARSPALSMAGPDVISRGFVYVRESENLREDIREIAKEALDECERNKIRDWTTIKTKLKYRIAEELYRDTKRKPMILPVIMEV